MKRLLKHLISEPFVLSTSIAALIHSCWSVGTLFSGHQPPAGFTVEFAGWILPAFLISFSLDIGMLSVSYQIRNGQRHRSKFITFGILAASMFFLQFVYMLAHVPALPLSAGVAETWQPLATTVIGLSIFVVPGLLPLSVLMYTFSHTSAPTPNAMQPNAQPGNTLAIAPNFVGTPAAPALVTPNTPALAKVDQMVDHSTPNNRDGRRALLVSDMGAAPADATETIEAPVTELDTDTENDTQPVGKSKKGKPNRPQKATGRQLPPVARNGNGRNVPLR